MAVQTGLDNLLKDRASILKNRSVGIMAHPASLTSSFEHILPALLQMGVKIEALFGPEHGFMGEAQDMEPVSVPHKNKAPSPIKSPQKQGSVPHKQGSVPHKIPLYSLYGDSIETLSPSEDVVNSLDALVVDLADVGSRYYTFVWSAILCLDVCIKTGTELIILDRPNPLNGITIEGAPQESGFLSFVGLWPVPVRHGLTVGEIVKMAAKEKSASGLVTVVPVTGWNRELYFSETGLHFVAPSPNMPTLNTAVVYPGGCLLEATQYSEGRGTTAPFELFGAPGVDNTLLCNHLNNLRLPGVHFRPVAFKPMFQKHAGEICTGAAVHVTDREQFLPYKTGIAQLLALHKTSPSTFTWRPDPYEFVKDIPAIDLLTGSSFVRSAIEQDADIEDIFKKINPAQNEFSKIKTNFHLY